MADPIPLAVDEIGQYINSGSCIRHFHLALENGKAAFRSDLFSRVGRVNIDPVLAEKGRRRESLWAGELAVLGFKELRAHDKTFGWEEFAHQIKEAAKNKDRVFARQVTLSMDIGPFHMRGKPDFIILYWDNNRPRLRVVECKSTRKDKTYHHIQLATYLMMVRTLLQAAPIPLDGLMLGPDDVEAVVARINEGSGTNQEIMRLRPLDLDAMIADIGGMLRPGGRLALASLLETDKIAYCLNPRCDSCSYSPNCLLEGQRNLALELIGLSLTDAKTLRAYGISDLGKLAELDPAGEVADKIRKQPGFGQSLGDLKSRARARLSTMPQSGSEEYNVLAKNANQEGQLPAYSIGGRSLVRIYISVERDYSEERLCALSANITASQNLLDTPYARGENRRVPTSSLVEVQAGDRDRKPFPYNAQKIVKVIDSPWAEDAELDGAKEALMIDRFFSSVADAIRQEAGSGLAPIHFYFWSQAEVAALIDACQRCGHGTLEHLVHLLGCREALDQMTYSTIQDEIKAHYALGWTCTGLIPTASLRWFGRDFHWTRSVEGVDVNLASTFRKGLFDFKAQLWMNGNELRGEESPGAKKIYIEARSLFNDSLPLSYLESAWRTAGSPNKKDWAAMGEGSCDLPLLEAYMSARAEALRWLEERMTFKNKRLAKQAIDTKTLEKFRLVTGPEQAALDFLRLETDVRKVNWTSEHCRPAEDLVAEGKAIPLRNVTVNKIKVGDWPSTFISGEVDLEAFGATMEGFRDKCGIWDEEWFRFVLYDSGLLPLTVRDLKDEGLTLLKVDGIDESGRIQLKCIFRSSAKPSRYVAASECGHAINYPRAILLKSISNFQDEKADATLLRNSTAPALSWFDRQQLAVPEMDAGDADLMSRCAQALSSLKVNAADELPALSPDQVGIIIKGMDARVQILQGPPGTGKTTTTAADALLRASLHRPGEALLMAGTTRRAKEELRDKILLLKEGMVRALRENGLGAHEFLVVDLDDKNVDAIGEAFRACASGSVHILGAGTINEFLRNAEKHLTPEKGVVLRTLIVDEASMMVMPHFMALASYLAPRGQIMLAGDNRQLAPILEHDWEHEDRPGIDLYHPYESAFVGIDHLGHSASNNERRILRSALNTTYRLPPDVCTLLTGIYRLDHVKLSGKKKEGVRTVKLRDDPFAALWSTGGIFLITHDEAESHNFNRLETKLLQKIMAAMPSHHQHFDKKPVVVITPHRVQRAHLRTDLSAYDWCLDKVDTVERMQGGEANTVIVSGTQSDPAVIAGEAGFILDMNRSNVMLSRSKDRLIVVCSESLLNSVPADFDDYHTAFIWKSLRDLCTRQLTQFDFDGYGVKIFLPDLDWIKIDYGPQGPIAVQAKDALKGERRELWNLIEETEIGMRRMIRRIMAAKGEHWEEEHAKTKKMDRARTHLEDFALRYPGSNKGVLDFTYLADLFDIVMGDWPRFSSILGRDKAYWSMKSGELNYSRNLLAHFNGDVLRANEIRDSISICRNILELMAPSDVTIARTEEAQAKPRAPARAVFGKYVVHEVIGSGGFSDIYQVEKNGRKYGLKVPKGVTPGGRDTVSVSAEEVEAYRKEMVIWSDLTSKMPDAVVALIEAGEEPFPYFVMELAETNLKREMGKMSEKEKRSLFDQLLGKLQAIHEQGVVHKDLKPENILFLDGTWKFSDFGLAKLIDSSSRSSTGFKGTMAYMAPEQTDHNFGKSDVRTDIWQMGILLVELFAGQPPSAMYKDPDLTGLPEDLGPVAMKALQKEQKDRYQSAKEFREALSVVKGGRPSGIMSRLFGRQS